MAEIKGKFTEPLAVLDFLKIHQIDAVFLDIEMPDMDGIELANRIVDLQEGMVVVFVTAYNQYAVEAFRLNALDYLMKPVTAERLRETLERIIKEKTIPMNPAKVQIRLFGKFSVTTDVGRSNSEPKKPKNFWHSWLTVKEILSAVTRSSIVYGKNTMGTGR